MKKVAAVIFLVVCAVVYWNSSVVKPAASLDRPSDFLHYYRAALAILSGHTPFGDPEYLYPPAVAFLMASFGRTDYATARTIWFVLSHTFLLLAAFLLWRYLGRGWLTACCIGAVWAFTGAAPENFFMAQIGPLLTLVCVVAIATSGAPRAIALAAGFGLKVIPGYFALALLLQRDWRSIVTFVATAAALLCIPLAILWTMFDGPRSPVNANYWMGTPALLSWSMPSVALRVLDPPRGPEVPYDWEYGNVGANLHLPLERRIVSIAVAATVLVAGAAALALTSRGRLNAQQTPWAIAGLISVALAAAPVCWTHYQVLQYPGLAMLLNRFFSLRQWMLAAVTVACAALLYKIPVLTLTHYYTAHHGWTTASPATLYVWTSIAPFASLALFALFLRVIKTDARVSIPAH